MVVILGFVTSLLPAWNYNPEDAAVFAAGQAMEDQVPAQGGGGGEAPGAENREEAGEGNAMEN